MPEDYLSLINVSKKYDGFSLDSISYSFKSAKWYYIRGENGSGKTTLLNLIVGFLIPNNGKILFWEKELIGNEKEIKNRIAFVPNYVALPSHLTPVFLSNLYKSMYDKFNKSLFYEHLKNLGIENTKQQIGKMSDGMKKKVLIALELAYQPDIFIADEICNNLDEIAVAYCFEQIDRLRQQKKSLIIITSHDSQEIMKYNPIIIKMKKGKIVQREGE